MQKQKSSVVLIALVVAMGGNFGGTIDPAVAAATMEIDYIRVYQ